MQRFFAIALFFITISFGAGCQSNNHPAEVNLSLKNENNPAGNQLPIANAPSKSDLARIPGRQRVEFKSLDGSQIVGTFYAAAGLNSPAVLMLHQWGSNRASFDDLAKRFQANGIASLAIDGRGFGESTKKSDGGQISPGRTDQAVAGMKTDVAEAIKWLTEKPEVDKNRIGIVGASYGSSLAIIEAAGNPNIKAVALLSPGLNYFGNLPTAAPIKNYGGRPILLVASENDAESAEAVRQLDALATGDKHQTKIYSKAGHGTEILSAGVGLDKLLEDFFRHNL